MLLVRRHDASANPEPQHPRATAPPEPVDPSALTGLPAVGRGADASRAAIAARLQQTHGNQAVQAMARGTSGRQLQRKVSVERGELAGVYDSSVLRPFLDGLAKFIDANYKGEKMKRGVLSLIHDQQNTYVFDSLHLVVGYMTEDVESPAYYRVEAAAAPAAAQATQAPRPRMAMQAFAFPSDHLKGINTHLGNEVKRSSGKGHTITEQDLRDMISGLTTDSLFAERVQSDVARHDFQNFGSREKDDFCNFQVQIGGSDLYYKRKDTSFSAVIVDKRLLDGDLADLLGRVRAMHQESFTSRSNVILTTDDDAGRTFIAGHSRQ